MTSNLKRQNVQRLPAASEISMEPTHDARAARHGSESLADSDSEAKNVHVLREHCISKENAYPRKMYMPGIYQVYTMKNLSGGSRCTIETLNFELE